MPPLDAPQRAALVQMLGCPVPSGFDAFLARFPASLSKKRYAGLTHRVADYELFEDPTRIVEANLRVRAHATWGTDGESPWGAEHLVIGVDLSGDVIYVDAREDAGAVRRYLVETGESIEVAPDVGRYAEMLASDDPTLRRS
jgi:hypothetical protein